VINISENEIRVWAKMGPRAVYGQTILALAENFPDLIALSADLGNSSGLDRFKSNFPNRFINVGIAEQNLVGVASGLAKEGLIPFASSFAPFITMRACEQIRMNLGYMQLNVKLVAIGSGLSMGFLGNSHYGLEDIAIVRAIPNITILSPADCVEVVKCTEAAALLPGPVFIRLTGAPGDKLVYEADYEFEVGKSITLREGNDVVILATGSMVSVALAASENLLEAGVSAKIVNVHTIRPLDHGMLKQIARDFRKVVIIEEHSKIGGLGSAIAETYMPYPVRPEMLHISLDSDFGPTAEYKYLLDYHGLTSESVFSRVLEFTSKA
jgi:transketolase